PFFRAITRCRKAVYERIVSTGIRFEVPFGRHRKPVELFEFRHDNGFRTVFVDSPEFFTAPCDCGDPPAPETPCNPYRDPARPRQLLHDALFFCKVVPEALARLGYAEPLVLYLQDWEAASVAAAIRVHGWFRDVRCVLTLHNSYDQRVSDRVFRLVSPRAYKGSTILGKTIPLMDSPVSTVSQQFAKELVTEPLHTRVYAPHLQPLFRRKGVIGIDNGVFGTVDLPSSVLEAARRGDLLPLRREKTWRRNRLIEVLEGYRSSRAWGRVDFTGFEGPIFLMFGRDDPRQKGYDVAAAAIDRIPKGKAKFILTPIPGDEGLEGLQFLRALARRRPGEVMVFPFRMQYGYHELQRGASFLLLCSFYEPFGGATEGYASGTPVVARATGGLIQQVCPAPTLCLTASVKKLAAPYHSSFRAPTGLLFREPELPARTVIAGWRKIVACRYWPHGDRVAERSSHPLFEAMVQQAVRAIEDAIELFTANQERYVEMIANGIRMLDRFSWARCANGYRRLAQ
ncbi:MAG: glycosyltransferase, partial [Nitrospirae bacterium]